MRTRRFLLATTALTAALGACERLEPQVNPPPVTPVITVVPIEPPPDAGVTPSDAVGLSNLSPIKIEVIYANTKGSHYDQGLAKPATK